MANETIVTRSLRLFVFASLSLALLSTPAWSQITTTGTLDGTVTDSSGASVPQAAVTVISEDTLTETHTQTNGDGSFAVPGLAPGHYKVTIVKSGFQTYSETGIVLSSAQTATVKATLTVGEVATSVNVQASAAHVQTSTPEVSSEVTEQQVSTLPLNGRNFQSLSFLMPGVTNTSPDTALGQGGFLTTNVVSINGQGIQSTMYYIDGVWNQSSGSDKEIKITPNPDSIEEVRVLQNNFGAQYTLNGSNVLLLETKSGTDTFHGTAYDYVRNDAFDARNFFSPTVSSLKQNIFGFSLGGPVYIPGHYNTNKDKTFFFWSEQWVRQNIGSVVRGASPTAAQRNGAFTTPIKDPATGLPITPNSSGVYQIPANEILPASVSFLNVDVPLPNYPSGGFLDYVNSTPTINSQRDDDVKLDHNITSKLRLMAEFFNEPQVNNNSYQTLAGDPYPTTGEPIATGDQTGQIRLTQLLSPSMVNTSSVSMGMHRVTIGATGIQFQSQIPGLNEVLPYPITPRAGEAADRLPMIPMGGGYAIMGLVYILPVFDASETETAFSDDWSWLKGKHYLQAGVQYMRGGVNMTSFAATGGEWIFAGQATGNAMADFLTGHATELQQLNTEFRGYNRYTMASPYVQDQWKVTRRLTLTLGLRYVFSPNPRFVGPQTHLYSNFVPSLYNPAEAPIVNNNGTITATPNYNPTNGIGFLGTAAAPADMADLYKNYWNPTFGFAWDPFGNGKTSVRGGYGVTHDLTLQGSCQYECLNNPPSITTATLVAPNWPNSLGASSAPVSAPTFQGELSNLRAPVVQSYSLGVQRQFGEWLTSITGAGNIVTHLTVEADINQPVPEGGYNFNPLINPGNVSRYASSLAGAAPYQGYGALDMFQSLANGNWDALEATVRHPVGHGLFFSAAYTWQHGLSDNRGVQGIYSGNQGVQDLYHPADNYGTSNSNANHVLAISGIWSIPLFHSSTGLKKTLLGGWQYSDVTTIQSGFALDPGLSIGTPGLASRSNRVPGTSVGGPKTVSQWFNTAAFTAPAAGFFGNAAPGSITGPGVIDFDMALYKDFKIKERYTFQFRSEFFNIFNHTNFSGVSTNVGAGNYGQITSALDPRIIELAMRFQF